MTFSSTAKLLFDFSTSLENITEIDESLLLSKLSGESGSNLSSGLTLAANSLLNNSTAGFRNVRTVVVFLLTQQKYDLSGISNSDLMALQNAHPNYRLRLCYQLILKSNKRPKEQKLLKYLNYYLLLLRR